MNGPLVLIEDSYDLNRAYDRCLSTEFSKPQVLHLRLRVIRTEEDVNHFDIEENNVVPFDLI